MNDSNLVFYGNILSCLLGDFLHRGCVSIPHYFLFFLLFFTNLSGKNSTYLPFSDQWNFPHLSIGPVYLRFKGCWVVFIIFIPFFFFFFFFPFLHLYFIYYKYRTYYYKFTISQNNEIQSCLLLSLPFLFVH